MNNEIEAAITTLTGKISSDLKADEALKFTQAIANLAHAGNVIAETKRKTGDT